jgi:hypothetical protein
MALSITFYSLWLSACFVFAFWIGRVYERDRLID